jgi:hypothetical protein
MRRTRICFIENQLVVRAMPAKSIDSDIESLWGLIARDALCRESGLPYPEVAFKT